MRHRKKGSDCFGTRGWWYCEQRMRYPSPPWAGFFAQTDKYYQSLKTLVDEAKPANAYDLQARAMDVARKELPARLTDSELLSIKDEAFQRGILEEDVLSVVGILLRNLLLKEKNIPVSDVDKHDSSPVLSRSIRGVGRCSPVLAACTGMWWSAKLRQRHLVEFWQVVANRLRKEYFLTKISASSDRHQGHDLELSPLQPPYRASGTRHPGRGMCAEET